MAYVEDVLRRRQEAASAWRERYDPLAGISKQLLDIESQMQKKAQNEAEQKRQEELLGLKKSESQRLIEKYQAETRAAETDVEERRKAALALAAEREQRGKEWEARAAAQREEARRAEQEATRQSTARMLRGMLQGREQTAADVWGGARVGEMEKQYAKRLPGALAEGAPEDVAALEARLAGAQASAPAAVPGGVSMADVEEIASASGMSPDELLSLVQDMESEAEKGRAGLGLTEAKRKKEEEAAALLKRKGYPKPEKAVDTEVEQAKRRKVIAEASRAEFKAIRDKQIAEAGGFAVTDKVRETLKTRREAMIQRKAEVQRLKNLIKEYPDIDSYVGTVDQYITQIRAKFGEAKAAKIMSAFGKFFDRYRVTITGAAANPDELKNLLKNVPNMGDSLGAILGKIAEDDDYLGVQFDAVDAQLSTGDLRAADKILGITSGGTDQSKDPFASFAED